MLQTGKVFFGLILKQLVNCNTMYERMGYMGILSMTDKEASAPGHDSRKRSISVFPLEVLIGATST